MQARDGLASIHTSMPASQWCSHASPQRAPKQSFQGSALWAGGRAPPAKLLGTPPYILGAHVVGRPRCLGQHSHHCAAVTEAAVIEQVECLLEAK